MARRDSGIEIEGARYVRETLGDVMPREARSIARRAITAVARYVRDTARGHVPVNTGTLKKAIRSRRTKGDRDEANAAVHVTTGPSAKNDGWYWHMVEFRTKKSPAQPFIQPTLSEWGDKAPNAFADEWWTQFRKEMEKRAKKQRGAK